MREQRSWPAAPSDPHGAPCALTLHQAQTALQAMGPASGTPLGKQTIGTPPSIKHCGTKWGLGEVQGELHPVMGLQGYGTLNQAGCPPTDSWGN